MSNTDGRPVISEEEFEEDVTARLSDFNALKEMFHELEALKRRRSWKRWRKRVVMQVIR